MSLLENSFSEWIFDMTTYYSIDDMCKAGLTSPRGIRFWEEKGLLGKVERTSGDQRRYTEHQIWRARIIAAAQYCSFSLDEIGQMLAQYGTDVHLALQVKLASVANTALALGEGLPMPIPETEGPDLRATETEWDL